MRPNDQNRAYLMDRMTERKLAGLRYESAEFAYASSLPVVESIFARLQSSQSISREDKKTLERYQAALLAFVTKELAGSTACTVEVAVQEDDDFDCVIRATTPTGQAYRPVQLKEVPSRSTDAHQALQEQIVKLRKYGPELSVGIWINCDGQIRLQELSFNGLRIEQLWIFGTAAPGVTTIHGGTIDCWVSGVCWSDVLNSTGTHLKQTRFKRALSSG